MNDIKVGDQYWTFVQPQNTNDTLIVKRIVIKDIFTVMVTVDVNGYGWSMDVPRDKLYKSEEEALEALKQVLEKD